MISPTSWTGRLMYFSILQIAKLFWSLRIQHSGLNDVLPISTLLIVKLPPLRNWFSFQEKAVGTIRVLFSRDVILRKSSVKKLEARSTRSKKNIASVGGRGGGKPHFFDELVFFLVHTLRSWFVAVFFLPQNNKYATEEECSFQIQRAILTNLNRGL